MWACYKGNTEVAKFLLSKDANPNVKGEVNIALKCFSVINNSFVIFNILSSTGNIDYQHYLCLKKRVYFDSA